MTPQNSRRKHGIWEHFEDSPNNKKYAICKHCNKEISRGNAESGNQTTASMKNHMKGKHKEINVSERLANASVLA